MIFNFTKHKKLSTHLKLMGKNWECQRNETCRHNHNRWIEMGFLVKRAYANMGQTPHHCPAKTVFSTVPSNSDWQWTVELRAGWRRVPLSTVSQSCKEQLKIGCCWPVVWRLTFSGVGRMITCRRLNILCRVNTKGKWQKEKEWNYYVK